METIKKLLRPGAAEDDQTLYGQENTTNTTDTKHQKSGLTGEGSHLSGSQNQPDLAGKYSSTEPSSTTHNSGGLTGQGSHLPGATDSSTSGQHQSTGLGQGSHDPSSAPRDSTRQGEGLTGHGSHLPGSTTTGSTSHHTGGLTGQGSHLSGATDNTTSGQHQSTGLGHGSMDPGATRHIGGGGLGHGQHERSDPANMDITSRENSSGLHGDHSQSTKTTQGPHSSDMMNKVDPRVDSDQSRTTRTSDQTGNYAGTGSTGLGQREHEHATDTTRGNTSLPGYGIVQGQTTTGPHSSNTLNKADPRVDSDFSNTRRAADESGNFGGAGAGMTTAGHREHEHASGNVRGNPVGQSTQSQTTQGPHSSDLMNKMDPRVDSDNSKTINSGAGYSSTSGGSHQTGTFGSGVSGPHQTMTANLLDPKVNTSGQGHENAIHHHEKRGGGAEEADNDHRDAGKKAAVAGAVGLGAIGMGSDNHQSRFPERGADGSAGGNKSMMPGTFPEQSSHLSGGDSQSGTQNVSGIPDRTRTANDPTSSVNERDHHHGRDAALVGGAAGLGGAAHSASKHSGNQASEPVHNSDMLNRVDPRVTTDNSGTAYGSDPQDRSHGIMTGNNTSHQTSQTTPHTSDIDNTRGEQHHHGRDAALGAGAVGAGYGLGRQHESNPQDRSHGAMTSDTTSHQTSQTTPHTSDRDNVRDQEHHHGRDAALGAGAAGAAYGVGRQHESHPQDRSQGLTTGNNTSSTTPYNTSNTDNVRDQQHHHGRDAALGAGAAGAAYGVGRQHESHPQDSQGINTGNNTSHQTSQSTPHTSNTDNSRDQQHHHGRDAALGAGAAGAAYGAGRQHESHPPGTSTTTTTTTNTSKSTAGPHSSDMLNRADPRVDSDRSKEQSRDHNYGRDAALVGGAGAAAIGAHELSERDQKQAEQDRKHAEKDQQHAQKLHDKNEKDRAHEQKEHDKAVLAAEKERHHREQERQKQLRDNDKHDVKDEKHAQKEHKGLFSFLHRDKSKKYTQEEEDDFARQEREHNASQNTSSSHPSSSNTLVGAAAVGGTSLGDKLHGVERNRGVEGAPHGFPHGGGPHVDANQHTGEPLAESSIGSNQTAPHTSSHQTTHAGTHDDDLTHSHSRTGAMGEGKQSANEYNTSRGQQGDILSPSTDSNTHSGTGSSTAHPSSTTHQTSGVQTGESHGVGIASGSDGRNKLHKDAPAGRY